MTWNRDILTIKLWLEIEYTYLTEWLEIEIFWELNCLHLLDWMTWNRDIFDN